jgi:hypothetical protein
METLDPVQNKALRLICGTFSTASTAAVKIIFANVPPLGLQGKTLLSLLTSGISGWGKVPLSG